MKKATIPVSQRNAERIYEILGIKLKGYTYLEKPKQMAMDFPGRIADNPQPKENL